MATIAGGGVVLLPGEARTIDVGGFDVVVHADGDVTDGAFSLIETGEQTQGMGPPLHVHRDCAESFLVLPGATGCTSMARTSSARRGRSSTSRAG